MEPSNRVCVSIVGESQVDIVVCEELLKHLYYYYQEARGRLTKVPSPSHDLGSQAEFIAWVRQELNGA